MIKRDKPSEGSEQNRLQVEEKMKGEGTTAEDDEIGGVVTVGGWGANLQRAETMVEVEAKYKTVDKKVRLAAVPLPERAEMMRSQWERKPDNQIGTKFNEEKLSVLHIGQNDFLTKPEEKAWRI